MAGHGTVDELVELRHLLDEVDGRLLEAVRERLQICVQIADYKSRHAVPMMQPHRVRAVHERAAAFAAANALDDAYLRQLYDVIIAESCRVEDEIIGKRTDRNGSPDADKHPQPPVTRN